MLIKQQVLLNHISQYLFSINELKIIKQIKQILLSMNKFINELRQNRNTYIQFSFEELYIYYFFNMSKFDQVKKLAKNITIFREIIKKGPTEYKQFNSLNNQMDQHKMTRKQFEGVLDYISHEAQIVPPTKQQKYQLYQQFNSTADFFITKEQYQKFTDRVFEMLAATQNI